MSEAATCRSCGAAILWIKMESGKTMPLDATPTEAGTVIIRCGPEPGRETGHVETKVEAEARRAGPSPVAFTSHFATCPQAGKWRKE